MYDVSGTEYSLVTVLFNVHVLNSYYILGIGDKKKKVNNSTKNLRLPRTYILDRETNNKQINF